MMHAFVYGVMLVVYYIIFVAIACILMVLTFHLYTVKLATYNIMICPVHFNV